MAYDTLEELLDHLRNVTNLTVSCCNSKYRSTNSGGVVRSRKTAFAR